MHLKIINLYLLILRGWEKKMETFSEVTKIKIKILEEGVKFKPLSLFSDIIKEIALNQLIDCGGARKRRRIKFLIFISTWLG